MRVLLFILLSTVSSVSGPCYIEIENYKQFGDNYYIQISSRKAFGPERCKNSSEVFYNIEMRVLRNTLLIKDESLKGSQHADYYGLWVPYIQIYGFDSVVGNKFYFPDEGTCIAEKMSLNNFMEDVSKIK